MNRRKLYKALTHHEVRALHDIAHLAKRQGAPFNTMLTIHPGKVPGHREPLAEFVRLDVMKRLADYARNNGFTLVAAYVRENYDEAGREHVHVLLHVPSRLTQRFEAAVARWFLEHDAARAQGIDDLQGLLGYLAKQMTSQAAYALRFRIRREKVCRHTGVSVAPVLGRRLGMTANLRRALNAPVAHAGVQQRRREIFDAR